ncbi:alpha/beta hydrolase [Glaciibacter superstes]|uniref:alpha/beta hydrolase n=1 Tax=Glaciibacter superstes TaxID=501023 RepID=UPI0003B44C1A|nr:alpha/beta hydrolase [Glaciibacter superstes]
MNRIHPVVQQSFGVASRLSPRVAAALALPLFRAMGRRARLRESERATHESAARETLTVQGKRVQVYVWGSGGSTVLLVHGWQSRASRFATLVRDLRAEGKTVVAFDAPANGESAGRHTDLLEYIEIIEKLQAKFGLFDAIVGHSFGVLAALVAVADGVAARSVIGIAGVSSGDHLVQSFGEAIGLSDAARVQLADLFIRRISADADGNATVPVGRDLKRFDAAMHPVTVPLLLLHSRDDRSVDIAQSRRLLDAHPGLAELVEVDELGHNRILNDDAVLDRVLAFVEAARSVPVPVPVPRSDAASR